MALTNGFQLPFGIQPLNPVPTDAWSGPYEGINEAAAKTQANSSIPSGVRFKSLEVRLVINGVPKKYWYKNGTTDNDLVEYTIDATNSFLTTNYLPLSGGTLTGNLSSNSKFYGTFIDWTTLVRGFKIEPTLNSSIGSGDVYTYVYATSSTDKTYYRYIATDGSEDSFYEIFSGGILSNLVAKKQIII
jgi:hypothetical protein